MIKKINKTTATKNKNKVYQDIINSKNNST